MNVEKIKGELKEAVRGDVSLGCFDMSSSLGIQKMPDGYALMLNSDETHFYWLRFDGVESVICWNKWAIYRGAKENSKLEAGQ